MSIQRSLLEQELRDNNAGLEYFRSIGYHRCQSLSRPFKNPYYSSAGEIFWLEWRNKRITILLKAWFIVEDKGITCPMTLKAIT